MKAIIRILDEINCAVLGVNQEHLDALWEMYGIHKENYFHSPKYKLGVWDGKIRLFRKAGSTFIYLLPTIVKKLKEFGYELELDDRRREFKLPDIQVDPNLFADIKNEYGDPYILRDYQVPAINAVLKNHGGIIEAATGAGKSIISGAFTKVYGEIGLRCITIVPNTTLVKQSADQFKMWGLDCGQFDGKTKELGHAHLVTTWQSLKNVGVMLSEFDVIIVDECQGAAADVLSKLITEHGKNSLIRIGMTGTMPKDKLSNLQVRICLGDIRYIIPAHQLMAAGHLSTIHINIKQMVEPFDDNYFPDYGSEMSYLRSADQRNGWISNFVHGLSQQPKGNVLMLVSSKQYGKKLARQMSKVYDNVYFVSGDDVTEDRKLIYDLFKENDNLLVIATAQIAGVGLSIDRIFNLVLLDIGKSFIRVIQAVGRGVRKNDKAGKDHCEVYDICSSLKYSKRHLSKRVAYYKENRYPHSKKRVEYRISVDDDLIYN